MSQDLSKTIAESFKQFQSDFEIQYVDKSAENDHEVSEEPPTKKKTTSLEEAVTKLADSTGAQNMPSNEGKFEVLNSLKQELKKEETGPSVNTELANVVNAMLKEGLPEEKLQEKLNKYHRLENCEFLTKVRVNQPVWDHLTPTVRSQDVRLQKVQTSIFKGMCALTNMIDKLLEHLSSLPAGNDLLQKSTNALTLFANANSELNQRRREFIKPDLHEEYKHLCSSSVPITDQLFGNDLPKQVKELTEVNRVGKKVSTHSGRSTNKPDYHRHNSYTHSRGRSGNQHYRKPFLGSWKNDHKHPPNFKRKKEGNLKNYKIEFENGEPMQFMPPKEINFTKPEQEVIDNEIDKLLTKGVISETTHIVYFYYIHTP
ncbi:unnamed protein product [Pocillopora meandrina]|uniref:Uncharacterized protein n=1 Tax=Pocillopora meandrina TaxID=46732 RepID=A0AAU9VWK5_9CNID|nr:unnamed protein product [Pocillopora meandrina]